MVKTEKQSKPKKKEEKNKCNKKCIYANGDSEMKVCPDAPCNLIKHRFGIHEQICEYYTENLNFNNAYYYIINLIYLFNIKCEVDSKLEKDNSLGCKIFINVDKLFSEKKTIKYYQKLIQNEDEGKISDTGMNQFKDAKVAFIRILFSSLKVLGHLVMTVKNERFERKKEHKMVIQYYDQSFKAAKKYGMAVKPPDIFEMAFSKAATGAGFNTKQHSERNKERILQAEKETEKKKLIEEIRKQITETGQITPELQERLKELQNKD